MKPHATETGRGSPTPAPRVTVKLCRNGQYTLISPRVDGLVEEL